MFSAAGTIRQPVTRGFSDELLSLRGVAAFMVLVYHVGLIFPHGPVHLSTDLWADGRVLMLWLSSGPAWVTFFFVHSGFVLTLSLNDRLTLGRTGRFYLRRIFRLWPMVAFSSAASLAYMAVGFAPSSNPVFSPWFRAILDPQAGDLGLLRNLALASAGLNWFFWSLQVEAVASVILPFFVYTARYFLPSCLLVIGLYFLILCLPIPKQFVDGAHSAIGSPLIAYLLCFMAGSISAYLQPEIGRVIRAIGPNVILALSLLLLVATRWLMKAHCSVSCACVWSSSMARFPIVSMSIHSSLSILRD
jgi:peptidoglycan/LPS O-acetylase OafA/YrhL